MIPEQAREDIVRRKRLGQSWTSLAKHLEVEYGVTVHRTTVQRWHDREVYSDLGDSLLSGDDRIKLDKKVATFKAESTYWKKLYEQAIKQTAKTELLEETIADLAPVFKAVKIPQPTKEFKKEKAQIAVAPLSDTHIGDRVEGDQMIGLNSYNMDIFNRRLYGWANQIVQLVELRRNYAPINELVIPMLGDMISGDIHDELARTNIDNCMGQMIRGANLIGQALMFLASHFNEIRVPCVVGNHGRMTRKPPMKDKYMDWDYMLYQWVAAFCRDQKNIKFDIPRSFITSFNVHERTVVILHGDMVSGSGSGAAVMNSITKMRSVFEYGRTVDEENLSIPKHIDSVMMGHFHRIDEYDIGTGEIHIVGTMKGGDEFALQRLQVFTPPKHILTYWHPQYGCIGKETIYLNKYDRSKTIFNDTLSDVWIDA